MTEPPNKRTRPDGEKPKGFQYRNKRRHFLEIGQRGFLATCNYREKDCVRECYNVLTQYADELYGPEPGSTARREEEAKEDDTETETDISDDLQKEIDATRAAAAPGRSRRFQAVDTGTKNLVFIKSSIEDPVELATKIVKDIAEKKVQKSRYLLRLIPIEVICKANLVEIKKAAETLSDKYFLKEGKPFAVVFNKRYNNEMRRDLIITLVADTVIAKNAENKVDLKNAELSVVVEIIKGKCCMSVVEGFAKYKKYNLVELGSNKEDKKEDEEGDEEKENEKTEDDSDKDAAQEEPMSDDAKPKTTDDEETMSDDAKAKAVDGEETMSEDAKPKPVEVEPSDDAKRKTPDDVEPMSDDAKRNKTMEGDEAMSDDQVPEPAVGNKLKLLLEGKKIYDDEDDTTKKSKDEPEGAKGTDPEKKD